MSDDDFPLNEGDFDEMGIALEQMAVIMAKMFKAFIKAGLSGPEAAALTAAYWQQQGPVNFPEPQED